MKKWFLNMRKKEKYLSAEEAHQAYLEIGLSAVRPIIHKAMSEGNLLGALQEVYGESPIIEKKVPEQPLNQLIEELSYWSHMEHLPPRLVTLITEAIKALKESDK